MSRLSALPQPTTLAAILILYQHNLVQSSGSPSDSEEYYEFNVVECLMRLRWGRILALTEKRLGPAVSFDASRRVMKADWLGLGRRWRW